MRYFIVILTIALSNIFRLDAKLVLPKILGNSMVLQQRQRIPIWGWSDPNMKVVVRFKGKQKMTVADGNGTWKVLLDAENASFQEATLSIMAGTDTIHLQHILIGEVWLCSGQSNMEFAMRKLAKLQPPPHAKWPTDAVENANNTNIRIFLVERKNMNPDSLHRGWDAASGNPLRNFSAVGYFFAKDLYEKLHVPIGVISSAIPGSRIEPWMPKEAMEAQPFFKYADGDSARKIDGDPGKFYSTMIAPLIPFGLKGFLWYQGESNCFLNERIQYAYKMKALIEWWRQQWNNKNLPFYYVQIAPYSYSKAKDRPYTVYSEPEFWEAQSLALTLPNTTMIATLDLNDNPSDLHPVNKWDVGARLANAAIAKTYHLSSATAMGPVFKTAQKIKNGFVVDFEHKGLGLEGKSGSANIKGFEVENENGVFKPADAVIKDGKVWVTSADVDRPISVRYAWREDASAELYNKNGLPALPFRSDNPLIKVFK
ncbi:MULTISPECIES: sialate O-acetylesterase [Chitinophagaceae]